MKRIEIIIPKEFEKFEQISKIAQLLKDAWENKLIESLTSPLMVTLSDEGKAVFLIKKAKLEKKCLISPIKDYDCNITQLEIEKCKQNGCTCPFQTPEILLEKFDNLYLSINDFVKVEPALIYPYKWVLSEIEKNLYTLSVLNIDVKILSFEYFANDFEFKLTDITLNEKLYNENIKNSINEWLDKEKNKLESEKSILNNCKQSLTLASKSTGTLFEPETLKEIILDANTNTFLDYEQRLIDGKYFDEQGTWLKSKIELVAFIMILDNNRYFKKKITGKNLDFSDYSNFFEKRYKIDISFQSKPSYRKKIKISGYFHFITSAE